MSSTFYRISSIVFLFFSSTFGERKRGLQKFKFPDPDVDIKCCSNSCLRQREEELRDPVAVHVAAEEHLQRISAAADPP